MGWAARDIPILNQADGDIGSSSKDIIWKLDWRAEGKWKTSLGEEGKGKAPGPVFSLWFDLTRAPRTRTMKRNNFPHGPSSSDVATCKLQHGCRECANAYNISLIAELKSAPKNIHSGAPL